MTYYTRTYNPQPTARVTSQELKNEFQSIDNALDAVEADVGKGIRAPEATTALPNAASRALKVMSFDASGNPIATVLAGDVADAADNAAIATAKAAEAAASAVAAHDSELAAAASAATVDIPSLEVDKYLYSNGVDMVWQTITPTLPEVLQRTITSSDTLIASDRSKLINAAGTFTLSLTAATTLGEGWYCWVRNTANGDVTVDPAASEQVDGVPTIVLKPGFSVMLTCNGSSFSTMTVDTRKHADREQITSSTTRITPPGCYVMRAYAFGAGAAGTTTEAGGGGGCAYGDIAVTPGATVTFSIASGIAKVTTLAVDRLTGSPASGSTAGTASKDASVTNGGAYSGGNGGGAPRGGGSSGSPLGTGGTNAGGWGGDGQPGFGGGGVGGSAGILAGGSGRGLTIPSTDPLLFGLDAPSVRNQTVTSVVPQNGGPGAGGGATSGTAGNVDGGFGGGGGNGSAGGLCGEGGFGGGGGNGGVATGTGGAGGYGGGGGSGTSTGGAGGAAAIIVFWG